MRPTSGVLPPYDERDRMQPVTPEIELRGFFPREAHTQSLPPRPVLMPSCHRDSIGTTARPLEGWTHKNPARSLPRVSGSAEVGASTCRLSQLMQNPQPSSPRSLMLMARSTRSVRLEPWGPRQASAQRLQVRSPC